MSIHAQPLSSVQLFVTLWTIAHQVPLFSARILESFPPLENLRNPGSKPHLLHLLLWQADSLPLNHLGSPYLGNQKLSSLVAQMVKCLPAMRETRVQSLGWEDLLEKETATHSSILAWEIPRTKEPGRLQSIGLQESNTTYQLNHYH